MAAASPEEALARARETVPDALVVDLTLGGASGWDLIRAVQADPRLRAVPAVVLSASSAAGPPPAVAPCAAYLTKPCPMAQLREVLERLVDPARLAPAPEPAAGGIRRVR